MKRQVYMFSANRAFGGGEMFLIRLAALLDLGDRFVVLSAPVSILQEGLQAARTGFIALPGVSGLASRVAFLQWCWRNRSALREGGAVFVLNGRGAAYFAPAVRWCSGRAPHVVCHTELSAQRGDWKEWLYGQALGAAGTLVAVSETVGAQHRLRWPSLRVVAIPNWLEAAPQAPQPAAQIERSGALEVAVVGRLDQQKGVHDIVRALSATAGIALYVYGDGPMRAELDQTAARLPHLTVHGHVTDLAQRLPRHAVLLSASYSESFSYAVAEGIRAGLLCIASDIPAHRELLGEEYPESLYFAPGNVDAMRTALEAARAMFSDAGGQAAADAIGKAKARLCLRNGPDLARSRYEAVLFGVGAAGTGSRFPAGLATESADDVAGR